MDIAFKDIRLDLNGYLESVSVSSSPSGTSLEISVGDFTDAFRDVQEHDLLNVSFLTVKTSVNDQVLTSLNVPVFVNLSFPVYCSIVRDPELFLICHVRIVLSLYLGIQEFLEQDSHANDVKSPARNSRNIKVNYNV